MKMNWKLIISIMLTIGIYTSAWATGASGNCNGNGSCGDTITNNTTNNSTTNAGGNGYATGGNSSSSAIGTGGAGGNATGGSSNSTAYGGNNSTDVRNTNTNLNSSTQVSNVSNSNKNSNSSTNTNKNSNSQGQGQGQQQGQTQSQSTKNSGNNTGNSTVTVEGDKYDAPRIPVSTAYAPSIAPTANCALSVSGGVSFVGFSGAFGKAYIDENCAALEKIRTVSLVLGDKATAEALMCLDTKYKQARLNAGRACPVEQE